MKKIRGIVLTTIIVWIVALTLHSFLLVNTLTISTSIIILLVFPFVWWLRNILQQAYQKHEQLREVKEKLDKKIKENQLLMEEKETIERIIDGVDDIAIYFINFVTGDFYISKGAEQIYGYPHHQLIDDPTLWKDAILPEDKEQMEMKLVHGEKNMMEYRILRSDGEVRWLIQRDTPIKDSSGEIISITGNIIDITNRKGLEIKLQQLAYYDELTDLANRTLLERHLKKALARSKRHSHLLGIMFIDLDGFKNVNDTMGHDTGDLLLREVAIRLNESVREEDFIARLGGDEFIIVFEETDKQEVARIAQRIIDKVSAPYYFDEKQANITPSMGITVYPEDGMDQESLLNNADKAMYFAKSKGKNNFQFYSSDLPDVTSRKQSLIQKIINQFQSGFSR